LFHRRRNGRRGTAGRRGNLIDQSIRYAADGGAGREQTVLGKATLWFRCVDVESLVPVLGLVQTFLGKIAAAEEALSAILYDRPDDPVADSQRLSLKIAG
jgi:hypothetical protein